MTGRKNRALQVPPLAPYKALENFTKALYGTTRGTCSARFFRPVLHFQLFQGHPSFLQCGLGLWSKQVTADFTH